MNKKAFTLIELLVVVLIIGILSAIALPQYQVAVVKARVMPLVSTMRSIDNAQQVYKLANGEYATDFNDLDVQVKRTGDSPYLYWFYTPDGKAASVYGYDKKSGVTIERYFAADRYYCSGDTDIARKVCKHLAGGSEPAFGNTYAF